MGIIDRGGEGGTFKVGAHHLSSSTRGHNFQKPETCQILLALKGGLYHSVRRGNIVLYFIPFSLRPNVSLVQLQECKFRKALVVVVGSQVGPPQEGTPLGYPLAII